MTKRLARKTCKDCKHAAEVIVRVGDKDITDDTQVACRRNPPQIVGSQVCFPVVPKHWWCGEIR